MPETLVDPVVDPDVELDPVERHDVDPAPTAPAARERPASRRRRPSTGRRRGRALSPPEPPPGREDGLSATLRRALVGSGLSLSEVARRSGIPASTLSRFVRERRDLTLETAGPVAEVLGLALRPRRGSRGEP